MRQSASDDGNGGPLDVKTDEGGEPFIPPDEIIYGPGARDGTFDGQISTDGQYVWVGGADGDWEARGEQVGGQRAFADISGGGSGVVGGAVVDPTTLRQTLAMDGRIRAESGIIIDRFDGGEVDFIAARDLLGNQFQVFKNMMPDKITRAIKSRDDGGGIVTSIGSSHYLPGQGFFAVRTEWDDSATPRQVSSFFYVGTRIVDSVGAWEINIHRAKVDPVTNGSWGTEFIDETAAKGGWERATSNRLVQGSSNVTFTASTRRISGVANLENYEAGEIIKIFNTTNNIGYFTVKAKAPAANSVDVVENLIDEANTSAHIFPLPIISMFAIGGTLRISNGNFIDSHKSQWYGHIKRDFWGQGVTYESNAGRFKQPAMIEAYSDWKLQDQELVAPIIVTGDRKGDSTSAANEVAIHIAGIHVSDWPEKSVDTTWNARDRVTCTFVYDFTQESELGKTASGEIGIEMGTIITAADARAFMVEAYTGASNASWNRRITAINIYYKFYDDVDWYEVEHLEINNGWKGSEKIFNAENTGYWVPIMSSILDTGTTDASGNTGRSFKDTAHGILVNQIIYIDNTSTIEPASLMTYAKVILSVDNIVLPVAPVDSRGVSPASWLSKAWCSGDPSTTAVATFYIPFTGEKAFTYFTNTGRSAKLKIPAIRWAAADTNGSEVLVGNINFQDDNNQTIRERTRVAESSPGTPDTFTVAHTKDVGLYTGDKIIAIRYYNANWWILMERNVVVLQPVTLRKIAQYSGIGCKWGGGHVITPFGLAMADSSGISLLPSLEELSFPKRTAYQDITLFECAMTYSRQSKKLFFLPDTRAALGTKLELWVYSFDLKAWNREEMTLEFGSGNFVDMGENDEPVFATANSITGGGSWLVAELRTTGGTSNESEIKSKEYALGLPFNNKIFGKGYLSYKSSSQEVTVEVYRNGETIPFKTIRIDASSSLKTVEVLLNVTCKLISFGFKSVATDFEIEDFIIPPKEIIFLDRR